MPYINKNMPEKIQEEQSDLEKDPQFEKDSFVREAINLASVRRAKEEGMNINELVETVTSDLPSPLKAMVMEDYLLVKEVTDKEDILKKVVDISYNRIMAGYERRIAGEERIPNEAYAMMDAMEKIDSLFDGKEPTVEDFKKIARVSLDLNGLKAVNDLNSGDHNKGDLYLQMAVLAIKAPAVIERAKELGINFEPERVTRDGGDEFGVIITSEQPLTEEALDDFSRTIQSALWDNKEVAKILDFNNPNVLANFLSMDSRAVVLEIENKFDGKVEEFKKAHDIPAGYEYRGAISAAAATLYDSMTDKDFEKKNTIISKDRYPRMIQKMMGATRSSSDHKMDENKKNFKGNLPDTTADDIKKEMIAAGIDIGEIDQEVFENEAANRRFLAEVYSRTDTEKGLRKEVSSLKIELEVVNTGKERMRHLVDLALELIDGGEVQEGAAILRRIRDGKIDEE